MHAFDVFSHLTLPSPVERPRARRRPRAGSACPRTSTSWALTGAYDTRAGAKQDQNDAIIRARCGFVGSAAQRGCSEAEFSRPPVETLTELLGGLLGELGMMEFEGERWSKRVS